MSKLNQLSLLIFSVLLSGFTMAQLPHGHALETNTTWNLTPTGGQTPIAYRYHPLLDDDSTKNFRVCVGCGAEGCLLNTKILASFDSRLSRFNGSPIRIDGFKLGLDVAKTFRFGVSSYWQRGKLDLDPIVGAVTDTLRTFDFEYFAFFSEFIIYQDFKWELSVPLAFGVGPRVFEYKLTKDGETIRKDEKNIGLTTISVDGHFKVVPWVALGAGFGYRHSFTDDSEVRDILNEPVYSFKVKFLLGNFIKFLFFRPKLEEEREAYIKERNIRKAARKK